MGFIMLFVAAAGIFLLWALSHKKEQPTGESFLVADRNVGPFVGTLTLTANWIQAPALIVSGALAYQGPYHFLALLLPNVAAMLLMGILAPKLQQMMRERGEKWYTIAQAIGSIFGPGARTMMFFSTFGALIFAVAYTLTGIRQWLSQLTGVPPWEMSVIIGAAAFLLVVPRGLLGAILGDKVKVALIGAFSIAVVILLGTHDFASQGPAIAASPMSAWDVLWFVGVPLGISLLGGPICNPDLAERAYAVQAQNVRMAYFGGGFLFALAALVFGSFGFLARSLGYKLTGGQLPMLTILRDVLPEWGLIGVTLIIIAILATALASLLASAGDVFSIEIVNRWFIRDASDRQTVKWSRVAMLIPIVAGTYLTSFEKIDVRLLQESMSVIRGEAIFPLVFAMFAPYTVRESVFWGMLIGWAGGILLTLGWIYPGGAIADILPFTKVHGKSAGALFALVCPLLSCAVGAMVGAERQRLAPNPRKAI